MALTGAAFALVDAFWPLLVVAFVGTLNPSAGDVSVFLPLEQALLAQDGRPTATAPRSSPATAWPARSPARSARCALGCPELLAACSPADSRRRCEAAFLLYAALGLASLLLYRRLPPRHPTGRPHLPQPLRRSRRIVFTLAALFSLDAFAGGFVVQSLLALWLFQRFGLSLAATGAIFFWTGLLSAALVSRRRADRSADRPRQHDGVHAPAGKRVPRPGAVRAEPRLGDRAAARAQRALADGRADAHLLRHGGRHARGAAAAASVTAVPRSLASAASPLLAGYLLPPPASAGRWWSPAR